MNFRKSILGLSACVALASMFALSTTAEARPRAVSPDTDSPTLKLGKKSTINVVSGPTCESTGFEAVEGACGWETGFMCGGGFVGVCTSPPSGTCTGDNSTDQNCCAGNPNPLNGWFISISSTMCNEPHIDTINPATGAQHMRLDQEPTGGDPPGCTGFTGACRISAFTPSVVAPLARNTVDFDVAMGDPTPGFAPFGSSCQWFSVDDDGTDGSIIIGLDEQAVVFYYDYALAGYQGLGFLSGNGVYNHIQIDSNPCENEMTYTLTDAAGGLLGQAVTDFTGLYKVIDRAIMTNDNAGFFWDFDNYSVVRETSCPSQCNVGDLLVQDFLNEECDLNDDTACPGRCRPAGDVDGECTCIRNCDLCSNEPDCVAVNGTNGPFLTHGGFFTYTADGPTGIDTCGSDFDTVLFVGDENFCATFDFVANDECFDYGGDCTDGGHDPSTCMPFASCYNNNTTFFESCICIDSAAGDTITIWAAAFPGATPPAGSNLMLTITKALACGAAGASVPNGACCNGEDGTCTDNVLAGDCAGPSLTYSDNKLCSQVACNIDTGGCCDSSPGLGGQCTGGVLQADCSGQFQAYSKLDDTCGGSCAEVTGSCCDTLTGNCFVSIQGSCQLASHTSWTLGGTCGAGSCPIANGACCDHGTNDPTVATCTQTDQAGCVGARQDWTKGALCSEVECLPIFQVIPTVSEWGLVVLSLLLLVGGKIYFGRREAALA